MPKNIFDMYKLSSSVNINRKYTAMANNYIPGSMDVWLLLFKCGLLDFTTDHY